MIEYRVFLHNPQAHLLGVECSLQRPDPLGQLLTLPAWIPGSYMIRDFARHIVTIGAEAAGQELALEKLDKQTWRCEPHQGPLTIRYQVYAWDLSVRGAHLDSTHAFFNGTSVFLRMVGQEQQPHRVVLQRPEHAACATWRLATSMTPVQLDEAGFGHYSAPDYPHLIDHPVEMGNFQQASFSVAGVAHRVAISGQANPDLQRLQQDLSRICETQIALFGELPPMPGYLFLTMAVGEGYGGLEHLESCALMCNRDDLPQPGMEAITSGYRRFLGLCSHEYFHLWNVKRIRPAVFVEAELCAETYTRQLWVFEGITSYYDDLMLYRSGVISRASWLELLAQQITRLMRTPGRLKQTVSDSSFDAWTKFYQQDENAPNAIVSYYNKGALIALCLDLIIRRDTHNRQSLDDLMRALWQRHGRTQIGLAEGAVEQLAMEITGLDLRDFFHRTLRTCEELPLQPLLEHFGIAMALRPPRGGEDKGGFLSAPPSPASPFQPQLGITLAATEARVMSLVEDGPAQRGGLSAGDLLIAVNGLRVDQNNLERLVGMTPEAATLRIHAFRRDELMQFEVSPKIPPPDTCECWVMDETKLASWLS